MVDTTSYLTVYVRSDLTESRLATLSADLVGIWKYVSLDLPTCASQFQLVIEGVIGLTGFLAGFKSETVDKRLF